MEAKQTPLRTAIMRIMSDMLDNPDEHGIYLTGRFMDRIEQLLCDMMGAPEVTQLSGSEAVMGFLGWLTTRDITTVIGRDTLGGEAIELWEQFCDANGLSKPRESWHELLTHPKPLTPDSVKTEEEPDRNVESDSTCDDKTFPFSFNGIEQLLAEFFSPCDDPECEVCVERKRQAGEDGLSPKSGWDFLNREG